MHTVDVVVVCTAVVVILAFAAVLARQRYVLRLSGAVPLAVQRGHRWLYGIGRYQGGELRWYRALGVGTKPSRILRRGEVEVIGRRKRLPAERGSLPKGVVVVECLVAGETLAVAFGDSAFTGFVSWLESAAPAA
ncbi:DUF2550 domain-containing protein [Jatrophihabitans endophyticus]|uniref:DUF2550 domain-containing protein n=1 Tax=Jatrophihabitans endophyticus TaxID=1206085 RepID=UPI001A0549D1|nr:DUF2550 domain-containing protein [Jatrophihabitans endophyticus]MBE7186884.1 DUF2550 domain-containing protein [Jatrophihabitans endophyticus]